MKNGTIKMNIQILNEKTGTIKIKKQLSYTKTLQTALHTPKLPYGNSVGDNSKT